MFTNASSKLHTSSMSERFALVRKIVTLNHFKMALQYTHKFAFGCLVNISNPQR